MRLYLLFTSNPLQHEAAVSQVDMMCQGDSIYDFVDKRDHAVWKSNLTQAGTTTCPTYRGRRYGTSDRRRPTKTIVNCSSDSSFYCRMYRARNGRRLPPACAEHKVRISSLVAEFIE